MRQMQGTNDELIAWLTGVTDISWRRFFVSKRSSHDNQKEKAGRRVRATGTNIR